jgi:hypothetical protein
LKRFEKVEKVEKVEYRVEVGLGEVGECLGFLFYHPCLQS